MKHNWSLTDRGKPTDRQGVEDDDEEEWVPVLFWPHILWSEQATSYFIFLNNYMHVNWH